MAHLTTGATTDAPNAVTAGAFAASLPVPYCPCGDAVTNTVANGGGPLFSAYGAVTPLDAVFSPANAALGYMQHDFTDSRVSANELPPAAAAAAAAHARAGGGALTFFGVAPASALFPAIAAAASHALQADATLRIATAAAAAPVAAEADAVVANDFLSCSRAVSAIRAREDATVAALVAEELATVRAECEATHAVVTGFTADDVAFVAHTAAAEGAALREREKPTQHQRQQQQQQQQQKQTHGKNGGPRGVDPKYALRNDQGNNPANAAPDNDSIHDNVVTGASSRAQFDARQREIAETAAKAALSRILTPRLQRPVNSA